MSEGRGKRPKNRYKALIARVFSERHVPGATRVEFPRAALETAAESLGIALPKNPGDIIYAFRYRGALPEEVTSTQPPGQEWIVEGTGRSSYVFRLVPASRVVPRNDLLAIGIPDATPELVRLYRLDDEQALLAIVRYNRLIDIFLGLTTFSLQNHLRTTVRGMGQIEIDELYLGIDKHGSHYAIPVQAKGGSDQIGVVQTRQDIEWCGQRFPGMRVRAIAAQFMAEDSIALFELTVVEDVVKVVEERHYRLVPASKLDRAAVVAYRS